MDLSWAYKHHYSLFFHWALLKTKNVSFSFISSEINPCFSKLFSSQAATSFSIIS